MKKLGSKGEAVTIILYSLAALGSAAGIYLGYTGKSAGDLVPAGDHRQLTGIEAQPIMMQTGSGFGGVQTFEMEPGKRYTVELVEGRIVVKEGIVCELPQVPEIKK
jgi:hypothetical protein